MKSYLKVCTIGSALVLAITVSLLAPIHAIADDTTPPPAAQTEEPPPTETETPLPVDEEADGEEAVDGQDGEPNDGQAGADGGETVPGLEEEAGVQPESASNETVNGQDDQSVNEQDLIQDAGEVAGEPSPNVTEIMEQLPEGTGIHIETSEGVVPLVTSQAESLILVGDPIWCPDLTAPIPNVGGCSASYTSLLDLVNNLPDPGAPGVIWIMEGVDSSASFISLDGGSYANWDANNLVIQGGWNGDALGTISSATTISVPVEVINWTGNITINDLIIMGASGTGLSVDTGGNVSLEDLELTGNADAGLYVNSGGVVTAENITANNNGLVSLSGYGAEIIGSEFHLNGTNEFSGNYESGLFVSTTGDIVTNNLTASNNGSSGYAVGAELYSAAGNVDLLGVNQFTDNYNNGLYVEAFNGSFTGENITASSNGSGNSYAPGAEIFASGLSLAGSNQFVGNNDTGLYADISGDISIANIVASSNGLPATYGPGAELYSTGTVTISGLNAFSNNTSEGLVIDAGGNISVFNADALNNGGSGMAFTTAADAYVECGSALDNGSVQVDTAMTGTLTLAGFDFGGDPDINLGIDESQLTLVSNACFTYPDYYAESASGHGGAGGNKGAADSGDAPFAVRYVSPFAGQAVSLDCGFYSATYILLEKGDGAIIPCPIAGSANLDGVEEATLIKNLPESNQFVSGMNLAISGGIQMFTPVELTDIVWYFNEAIVETGGYEAVYWDGDEWVDITDQIPPLLTIFFFVPGSFDEQNFAILYWDGASWIELSNGTRLGQGRIVSGLGYNETGNYFQANVNFTGMFVLVQK